MRNLNLHKFLLTLFVSTLLLQSCKDDSNLLVPTPPANASFSEEFDTTAAALSRGWKIINNSYPIGTNIWQNGGDVLNPIFNPYSQKGSYVGFIGTTFAATSAAKGVISNWLISPPTLLKNGDKIIFFTRSQREPAGGTDSTDWANRLQVRINPDGTNLLIGSVQNLYEQNVLITPPATMPVGGGNDNPGQFTKVLLDINSLQYEWHKNVPGVSAIDGRAYNANTNLQAYPTLWTRFEATVSGLNEPIMSRFAFRYFVIAGGNNGYASAIGIDKVEFKSSGY
jgi:hypothetical protein